MPRVLLAEDDAELRALLVQAFRRKGYEVKECVDGLDLVSKLGAYLLFGPPPGFDLVISDIQMPGATYTDVYRWKFHPQNGVQPTRYASNPRGT